MKTKTAGRSTNQLNPHIIAAKQNGADAGKAVRKNAIIAAKKAQYGAGVVAGGVVLGMAVAGTALVAFYRGIRG